MHVIFLPYGKIECVEVTLNDIRAQKYQLLVTKGKKKELHWINGQLRKLPFGFYEVIFPREYRDQVLTTLGFHERKVTDQYNVGGIKWAIIRKTLQVEKAPKEFKTDKRMLWIMQDVNIIPLGIKKDVDFVEADGPYKGWTHEAI